MRITFLGSGTALSKKRGWSSIFIDNRILLDPSPDVTQRLHKLGFSAGDLECVLISHFHADHYFGLPFLQLERHYFHTNSPALPIAGPKGLKDRAIQLLKLAFEDVSKNDLTISRAFEYHEYIPKEIMSFAGMEFTAHPVRHNDLDAYGLRMRVAGREIAYTGDTGFCKQLHELVKGADILISEMSHIEAETPDHLNLEQVRHLREQMESNHSLVIATHLRDESLKYSEILFAEDFNLLTYRT